MKQLNTSCALVWRLFSAHVMFFKWLLLKVQQAATLILSFQEHSHVWYFFAVYCIRIYYG